MAPFPISVSVAVPVTIPVLVPIIPPRRAPIALPAASFYATPSPAVGASSPAISTISIATVISSTLITAAISKSSRHARAPTAAAAAAPKGALGKLAASLPTHIFAKGPFSMQQRVGAYFYKMALYMCIGTCTGTLGTCAVNAASPEQHTAVGKSAFAWAMFMGFSANTRYNIVNGIERVLDTVLGRQQAMLRAVVVGLRLGNNYLGGLTWVVLGD